MSITNLEHSERSLLLYSEAAHFVMINQIKMNVLPYLVLKVFISPNLEK